VNDILARLVHDFTQGQVCDAAMDSTGVEVTNASDHFVSLEGQQRDKFLTLCMVVVCGLPLPASLTIEWGPRDDHTHAKELATAAHEATPIGVLWCDTHLKVGLRQRAVARTLLRDAGRDQLRAAKDERR
jgi:hypothetical protein